MHKPIRTLALLGLFVGSGALAGAVRADEPGKATTPKACVEGLIAEAKKENPEGMAAYMVEPFRTSMPKIMKATKAGAVADEKLVKALESKFGPDAAKDFHIRPKPAPKMIEGDVVVVEVKEEGDAATVKTKETKKDGSTKEDTIDCEKVDGYWFANPEKKRGKNPNTTPEQAAKMMDAMAGAMAGAATDTEALASDIEGGKVATKEDAKTRYGQIQMKIMQAMMGAAPQPPGGPKKHGKPGEKPETPAPPPEKGGE